MRTESGKAGAPVSTLRSSFDRKVPSAQFCRVKLEKHDTDEEMHPLQVLEDEYPNRPRMRINFHKPGHVGVWTVWAGKREHLTHLRFKGPRPWF